jgi:gamma-D-glutamyl-L-lysine dipeptidyl-peptidase
MNQPALCTLSVVPIRAGASDKEEIVSQLLFGELVEVLEVSKSKKNWCFVRCDWDGYEGWLDVRQLYFLDPTDQEALALYRENSAYCLDLTATLSNHNHFLPILLGATLPNFDGFNVRFGSKHYNFSGHVIFQHQQEPAHDLVLKLARRYLFAPYLWGGRSPFGIDCSGFTQNVFKLATGIRLRRDASQQIEQGKIVDFIELSQAADLAFFENDKGAIVHVGIVMPDNCIIHAAGQVRIDRLDHYGIFNEERGIYSHKLRLIKRLLPDLPATQVFQTEAKTSELPTDSDAAIVLAAENQISIF